MAENLLNSEHKATNKKSRIGYDSMKWNTEKKCWRCCGSGKVTVKGTSEDFIISCLECRQ